MEHAKTSLLMRAHQVRHQAVKEGMQAYEANNRSLLKDEALRAKVSSEVNVVIARALEHKAHSLKHSKHPGHFALQNRQLRHHIQKLRNIFLQGPYTSASTAMRMAFLTMRQDAWI